MRLVTMHACESQSFLPTYTRRDDEQVAGLPKFFGRSAQANQIVED